MAYSFISKNVQAGEIIIDNIKKILLNILCQLTHCVWSMCKHLRKFKLAVLYDCSSVYNFSRVIALNASLAGSFYLN